MTADPAITSTLSPIVLGPNQPGGRPYLGGEGIRRLRGLPPSDRVDEPWTPEDFVASTTEVFGSEGIGLTVLDDGRTLREAVEADPVGWLGREHVKAFGANTALLVKLLDPRERLFVHFHPDTPFARGNLGYPTGKTEAWVIVSTDGPGYAYLGFHRTVSSEEVQGWFVHQDGSAMLSAMNRVDLAPGDTLYVPAGVAHAIGPGMTMVELQQPVDLSIILEYAGYRGLDQSTALLGLPVETALANVRRDATSKQELEHLRSSRQVVVSSDATVTTLFPDEADALFRAELMEVHGSLSLAPSYTVLIVTEGSGSLSWAGERLELRAGTTVVVPHGAPDIGLAGELTAIRCRPPLPIPTTATSIDDKESSQ
jgi:mannose-6-phosphate isomerase